MKLYNQLFSFFLIIGLTFACKPEIEVPVPTAGSVDLSSYVAIGNSLTAGYSDGGLYPEVQEQSLAAIIARQLKEVNPDLTFNQPDLPAGNGSGYIRLQSLDLANQLFQFEQLPPDPDFTNKIPGTYHNLGIPGIRMRDITVQGYGASSAQGNPFFYRILGEDENNKSYLNVIAETDISLFTCWLGNNDVLGYATSGGALGIDGLPGTGLNGLTPVDDFRASFDALINVLNSKGASGVLLTIPTVTNIPFFTSIPWNALVLTAEQAEQAGAGYAAMIDPQIREAVKQGTINLVATDTVLSVAVIPDLADTTVFQQAYQQAYEQALAGGADEETAHQIALQEAEEFVESSEGQAAIDALEAQLNAELPDHLLGEPVSPELDPLFNIIDEQLLTNTELQQAIAQTVTDITQAYEAGLLPELEAVVEQQTQAQIETLIAAGIYPVFEAGPNGFVIEVDPSETNPLGIRQMVAGELVLFTAALGDELLPENAAQPKPDELILTLEEIANINSYRDEFNEIIEGAAGGNIAVLDSDALLNRINQGTFEDGVEITGAYIQGGAFSLDAVHLTPRGYAVVAKEIIRLINTEFGASIPPVNVSDYRAVVLP